jgi:hypothetical protein
VMEAAKLERGCVAPLFSQDPAKRKEETKASEATPIINLYFSECVLVGASEMRDSLC